MHTLEDIKHIMSSRDTTVYFFKDGSITVENSMLEGGKLDTFSIIKARDILSSILAFGDQIPIGVYDYLNDL